MEIVRAGLLTHHDYAAVGASVFRGVAVGLDTKLFDGIHDRIERDLTRLRLEHADSVVDILTGARAAAVEPWKRIARGQIHPGRQSQQRNEIAAVERQRHNLLLLNGEASSATRGLEERQC